MKILIVRLDGFTETLLTTPLIRCLHRQVDEAEIHVLTSRRQAHLLRYSPYVFALHVWEEGYVVEPLMQEEFDYVFDWENSPQSRRLVKQLSTKKVFVSPLKRNLFSLSPKRGWIEAYFESLRPVGIRNDGQGLDFFIPDDAKVPVTDIPHSHHAGFLCVAIGSSITKEQLQQLCQHISYPIILVGNRDDILKGEAIASADAIKIYNACGKFSLEESADLVRQSKLLIACHTGWIQIGAALKKEMVVLQQAQTPFSESSPYYGENFLQHHPAPFDKVEIKTPWWYSSPKPIPVNEIVQIVNRRLRKR